MAWDPESGESFGAYLRGGAPLGAKARTVEVVEGGRTWATRDQVLVDTPTRRAVQDQLGHVVTEHTDDRGGYHRSVRINLR
ncbi:hypothetical protein ACFQ08_03195 [Streptosporangium algeriense]|uniref:Uncharacterized protein n=1 Tax=Streptosporangium algeriense TaxID=1682748 RepID=A0ABW3DLE2_9ACTN